MMSSKVQRAPSIITLMEEEFVFFLFGCVLQISPLTHWAPYFTLK